MSTPNGDPDDEKGGSQVVPDKPGANATPGDDDHEQDREGAQRPSADKDRPDSF